MRASLTALAVALLCLAVLAGTGCGLKGDLYLPEDDASASPGSSGEKDDGDDQPAEPPAG